MNMWLPRRGFAVMIIAGLVALSGWAGSVEPPEGFSVLFNGTDFNNWKVPEGDNGHWRVVDGVIDYDALSEAVGDKSLWTEEE